MSMSRKSVVVAALVGATWLTGCVTINIYFPAAAAEKAADRIIDEVWQLQGDAAPTNGAQKEGEAK
jgi:hypothetical protein